VNPPAHHSEHSDPWFQRDPAPEPQPGGSWAADDPSRAAPEGRTGPGEASHEAAARHLAADDVAAATERQRAERVPRYTGSAAQASPASSVGEFQTMAQPIVGTSGSAATGIPPSLDPMLSHRDQAATRYPEPVPARGYQPTQPMGMRVPGSGTGPPASASQQGSGAAQSPAVKAAVVLLTLLAAVPSVLLLYESLFQVDAISASGVIGGTLMLIGLPLFAAGLLPLVGGGAPGDGARAVLRPPLVYLAAGALLLLAAGAAA
jgi:hypothetical protein